SSAADALTYQLHTATLSTTALDSMVRFYVDGMGMTLEGPVTATPETKAIQRKLWNIPEAIDWELYHLHRPSVPGLIHLRVLVLNTQTPHIHKSYNARELGPFSLGFPNLNQKRLDRTLRGRGWKAMAALQEGRIPRADGTTYRYWEAIYKVPDFIHAVGIERGDGMNQLAPVDSITQLGGPGYSAQVITNSDRELAFYTDVLGLELRADRHWKSSENSALGIEAGVPFRFSLIYAKGATHNHLLFLDYEDGKFIDPDIAPRVPNRGLGMWTFETRAIAKVKANAIAFGSIVIHEAEAYQSPVYGKAKVMTLLAPNGFLIEVFQKI
ncbi:MAG: extradiol dioxygenase, partial [Bacteroidota bacterium]